MEKFNYRIPRYPVNLPVRITLGNGTVSGHCHEISADGMCLELSQPLSPDYAGIAWLIYKDLELPIPVEFVHSSPGHNGVKFAFVSDQQRCDVAHFLRLLTSHAAAPGSLGTKPLRI